MRIGILTLPLHTNYGGILQAYALQTVLERMGHQVVHIEEEHQKQKLPLYKILPVYCKRLIDILRHGGNGRLLVEQYQNDTYPIVGQYTHSFIRKYIPIKTVSSFSELSNKDFDCLIVGSDQIWKPSYFKNIEDAFLNFAIGWTVKRIAYAPSLGASTWNYTQKQTDTCKQLVKKFDIVTVRENDSIELLKNNLGVAAKWVLDPTLLLERNDYLNLIKDTPQSKGNLLVYLLDISPEKKAFVNRVAKEKGLIPFYVSANPENYNLEIEDRIQPPLEKWLKGFDDADLVITDSFHACVFSVIFHKSFLVLGNVKRGQSRFLSLFDSLDLHGKILTDISVYGTQYINRLDDYGSLNKMRELSLDILKLL